MDNKVIKSERLTASEAKQKFGAVMNAVGRNTEVIVESHGAPKAVVLSFGTYTNLLSLVEKSQRAESLKRLREIRDSIRKDNPSLSKKAIDTAADDVSRETIRRLIQNHRVRYEGS